MGRTKHVYAHPGQHVWVHRSHTTTYNCSNNSGDGWLIFFKIIGIIAVIGVVVWIIISCWEFIAFGMVAWMICKIFRTQIR